MTEGNPGRDRTAAARKARTMIKHRRWAREMSDAGWEIREPTATWSSTLVTVLRNLEWLLANHPATQIDLDQKIVWQENGGFDIACLADPGLTPATRPRA